MIETVHVGNLVRGLLKKKKMKQNALARYMPKNKTNISKLMNKPDWHISEVIAAGECLKMDIFSYIAPPNMDNIIMEDAPVYQITLKDKQLVECKDRLQDERARREQNDDLIKFYKEKIRRLEIEINGLKT